MFNGEDILEAVKSIFGGDKEVEISAEDILGTHEFIDSEYDLPYKGLRRTKWDLKQIARKAREYSEDKYKQIAKLAHELKRAEIFEDGNKRTAYLYLVNWLDTNNLEHKIHEGNANPYKVIKHIGAYNVEEIENWIRTGEIDESRIPG